MSKGKWRKTRKDKKKDVKPTISKELKDCIYRLSYITDAPIKDVAEKICVDGLKRNKVISYLSQNFKRDLRVDNTVYMGDIERISVKKRTSAGQSERISIRFNASMHERLSALSYALDCSVSRSCALLLDATVRDTNFINEFAYEYLNANVDKERMNELKKVLQYINANNPYQEEISWSVLLSYLMKEVKVHAEKVQETVTDFIVNTWNK